jgi:hypothetical protein
MRLAVCQSGMYLDVQSEECQVILAERESLERRLRQNQAEATQTSSDDAGTAEGDATTQ